MYYNKNMTVLFENYMREIYMGKHQIIIRLLILAFVLALVPEMKTEASWDYSGGKVTYAEGKGEGQYPTIAIGDWEFQIKANEAVVRGYIGDNTDEVRIPDTVSYKGGEAYGVKYPAGDYPVGAIGQYAFSPSWRSARDRKPIVEGTVYTGEKVKKVILPATIDTIGAYAFYNNTNIQDVSFSGKSTLRLIGDYAFSGCTAIETLAWPESVEEMGIYGFSGCTKLSKINIPSKVTAIPSSCFKVCTSLANLTLHDGILSIGSSAFETSGIAKINFPDTITYIGDSAFYKCASLQAVHIPKSLKTISSRTFSWCTSLKSLAIPANITSIGTEAFSYDRGVTSITISDGPTSIGSKAFFDIPETKSVKIPYSVTSLGGNSIGFYDSVAGVRMIPGFVINGYYDTKAESYAKENNISFKGTEKIGLKITYSNVNYVTTSRNEVKVVAVSNKDVTSLTIPDTIHKGALSYKVTKISDKAYIGCKSLGTVNIGDNVTHIGKYAFKICSALETVNLGKKVTNIGDQAFFNCKKLKNTTIKSKKIKKIGTKAYKKTNKELKVKAPKSKIKDYKKKLVKAGAAKTVTVEKN
jgi:hypothetical protein